MNPQPPHVALAILYQQDQFLLQLRDNIPGIVYPGCWGLFGGHLEADETPETALKRELLEEISYNAASVSFFKVYEEIEVIRHIFSVPLTVDLQNLVLNEGWDMAWFTRQEIAAGSRYSEKAAMVRTVGKPHQKILLDFLEHHLP